MSDIESDRVEQIVELEKENTELRERVQALTRERDEAEEYVASRMLDALGELAWGAGEMPTILYESTPLTRTMDRNQPVEVQKIAIDPEKVEGIFEAIYQRFKKLRDWSTLKRVENEVRDARARLESEESNRNIWQDKAEKAEAKLKTLVGMIEGVVLIANQDPATPDALMETLGKLVEATETADTDAVVERCACWYRARLTEMRHQLRSAVEAVPEEEREKVAAPFARPMTDLVCMIESMDNRNYATLKGIIPGGQTHHIVQSIAREED